MQNVELNFHSTMVKYQNVIRLEISPAVILKVFVENKLMTVNVIIALITEARLLEFNQNFNKRFNTLLPKIRFLSLVKKLVDLPSILTQNNGQKMPVFVTRCFLSDPS